MKMFSVIILCMMIVGTGFAGETTEEDVSKNKQKEVEKRIEEAHEYMNELVGFGRHRAFEEMYKNREHYWENEVEVLNVHAENIEKVIREADEKYHHDLENFVVITRYAANTYDFKSLIYSHRVIHDLDSVLNDKNQKIYGATKLTRKLGKAEHYHVHVLGIVEEVKRKQQDTVPRT